MTDKTSGNQSLDSFTLELFDELFTPGTGTPDQDLKNKIQTLVTDANDKTLTGPIIELFNALKQNKTHHDISPVDFDLSKEDLTQLALKHEQIDEHSVSVGGRVNKALPIVNEAIDRVDTYLYEKQTEAPSGIELWDSILETKGRIKKQLNMSEDEWGSYAGQIKYCIDSVEDLAKIIDLPEKVIKDVTHVTQTYRMRLTPYYAS